MPKFHKLPGWPAFSNQEAIAVSNVIKSNRVNYWTGNECKEFEKEFSKFADSKYSISLSNGTVALELALIALDIQKGDEIIVTPRSFIASASSVVNIGGKPIFSDVDPLTGNITARFIKEKITKKTKAIVCVHLGGMPCEMDEIMSIAKQNNLFVIEDCAQAHGATYKGKSVGTFGDVGAWSFCQDKIITTGGEGGMVTTNSKKLWEKMRSYKDHGKNYQLMENPSKKNGFKWVHDTFGTNFRMTEMQASIGRIQLRRMKKWNALRKRNAYEILDCLNKFPDLIELPPIPHHVNHAFYRVYCVLKKHSLKKGWTRDRIIEEINNAGVPCFSGSCPEIYNEKAFVDSRFVPSKRLMNACNLGENSIAFLCHPTLRSKDMKFIKEIIDSVLEKASC